MNKFLQDIGEGRYVSDHESGSQEWHKERTKGIGGSEVGSIVGLNPYESAYTLWHKKKGLIDNTVEPNWSIRFGNAFERPILELFAEEHPELEIFETGTFHNAHEDWMHANPDGLAWNSETSEWEIIEVKTARAGWDEVPPQYKAQVYWYMATLGLKKATIVAVAGWNYVEHVFEYDEFEGESYKTAARRFYESLQGDTPPDWDGSRNTYETVRLLHPQISDDSVEIPNELASQLVEKNVQFELAQRELNKIKSQVYDAMGYAKYATTDGEVVAQRQARGFGKPYLVVRK